MLILYCRAVRRLAFAVPDVGVSLVLQADLDDKTIRRVSLVPDGAWLWPVARYVGELVPVAQVQLRTLQQIASYTLES